MTRSRKRKLQKTAYKWAGMPLASAAFACSGVAYAQQTETGGGGLEEVIVTAEKHSEDLQKVPISLQVMNTAQLEQLQVTDFLDAAKFLPSVSFKTLGPGQSQIFFRGISTGSENLHAGYLPSSGLYLDETPVTTIAGSLDVHMYDIARVEGLAGPQGTLYGASSLAGTLRIITNKPDPKGFSAAYDAKATKYGSGAGGGAFEGYVNLPVNDRAAVRLVGYYTHEGGYIDNVISPTTYQRPDVSGMNHPATYYSAQNTNANYVDSYGGRATLKVDVTDRWTVTPMIMYQDQKAYGNFAFDPSLGDLNVADLRQGYNKDHWYQSALTVEGKISDFDFMATGGYFSRKVDNLVDYSQYSIAYDYCLSGNCYTNYPDGKGGIIDPTQYTANHDTYTKTSFESRISTPTNWRLRGTLGAFYQRQTDDIRAEFRVDNLPTFNAVTGQPDILYLSQQDRADKDSAIFADLTYDLTDKLKVSAGIRQFWVDNTLYGFFGFNNNGFHGTGEALCFAPSAEPDAPCINTDKRVTENGETHRVNLTYQIDPDLMVYTTYSTGFRPGGNNRRPQALTWKSDTLTNYEVGWKSSWLDRRLRVNGAIFYEQWKDAQTSIQGQNGITSIVNAGDAESKGVEGEITWLAAEGLTLTLAGTYADAKTTTDFCKPTKLGQVIGGQVNCNITGLDAASGTQLPGTPNFKFNSTARYEFSNGDYHNFMQVAFLHQASTTFSLEAKPNAQVGDTPAFNTLDLSFGTAMKNWTLSAYIVNVLDKRAELARISECAAAYCYQHAKILPIAPMNFGIKFGQSF